MTIYKKNYVKQPPGYPNLPNHLFKLNKAKELKDRFSSHLLKNNFQRVKIDKNTFY